MVCTLDSGASPTTSLNSSSRDGRPGAGAAAAAVGVVTLVVGTLAEKGLPKLAQALGWTKEQVDPLKTSLESLKDRLKELADVKVKVGVERNELADLESDLKKITSAQEAYNEAKGLKGKAERDSASAVNEAIAETPDVAGALARADIAAKSKTDPALLAKKDELQRMRERSATLDKAAAEPGLDDRERFKRENAAEDAKGSIRILETQAGELLAKVGKEAEINAGKLLDLKSVEGGKLADHLDRLAKALDDAKIGGVAGQVRDSTPKAMAAQAAAVAQDEFNDAEVAHQVKLADEALTKQEASRRGMEAEKKRELDVEQAATDKAILDADTAAERRAKAADANRTRIANSMLGKEGKGGLGDQLAGAINERIKGGQTDDQIGAALAIQVSRKIKGIPGVPENADMRWDIASKAVNAAIGRQRDDLAAKMGEGMGVEGAAGAVNQGRNAAEQAKWEKREGLAEKAAAREAKRMSKAQQNQAKQGIAEEYFGRGFNEEQSTAMAAQAFAAYQKSGNLQQAMLSTMERFAEAYKRGQVQANQGFQRLQQIDRNVMDARETNIAVGTFF